MKTLEDHLRDLAGAYPAMAISTAFDIAHSRLAQGENLVDNTDPESVASYVSKVPCVMTLIEQGKRIHAVREVRVATEATLAVAMAAVDRLAPRTAREH